MESYGEQLKRAREAKNLDLDTISRETSISAYYLEGLEAEDNGVFPGEAYMLGFLRNYADYLGLKSEVLLSLYRSKELQESPIPVGLIVRDKPGYFLPLLITGIFSFVGLAAGCVRTSVSGRKTLHGTFRRSGTGHRRRCRIRPDCVSFRHFFNRFVQRCGSKNRKKKRT